jgi:hypothetical protein
MKRCVYSSFDHSIPHRIDLVIIKARFSPEIKSSPTNSTHHYTTFTCPLPRLVATPVKREAPELPRCSGGDHDGISFRELLEVFASKRPFGQARPVHSPSDRGNPKAINIHKLYPYHLMLGFHANMIN